MERYLKKNFDVQPKNSSEEALKRWRSAVAIVKNRKRRFRMIADLAQRSEALVKKNTQRRGTRYIYLCSSVQEMGEVKVLGAFLSPFAYRVQWALLHKGVKYEYIDEDLKNKSPLLLKCNPVHKKVPVLLHGEKPIAESLVILEYIDETWKENPLLPQDPLERAKARFLAKFADEKCLVSIVLRSEGKEQEKAVEEFLEALKTLEEELKGKEFFGGESVGFLDLVVGRIPLWLPVCEEICGFKLLDANTFPSLHAWGDRFLNVPFIKEKLPQSDKLLVILTDLRKSSLNKGV